jgi:hypothetical protein
MYHLNVLRCYKRTLHAIKPAIPDGMIAASAAPASMRSASPHLTCSAALRMKEATLMFRYDVTKLGWDGSTYSLAFGRFKLNKNKRKKKSIIS